jgi:hypothetical protein
MGSENGDKREAKQAVRLVGWSGVCTKYTRPYEVGLEHLQEAGRGKSQLPTWAINGNIGFLKRVEPGVREGADKADQDSYTRIWSAPVFRTPMILYSVDLVEKKVLHLQDATVYVVGRVRVRLRRGVGMTNCQWLWQQKG